MSIAIGDRYASWHCDNIYTVVSVGEKVGLKRSVAGTESGPTVRWDWDVTYWFLPDQVTAMEKLEPQP